MNIALALKNYLSCFKQAPNIWIAYSGGLDSQVLLHTMFELAQSEKIGKLHAIHINHGWHIDAEKWAEYCQQVCEKLNIPCHILSINAKPKAGESLEAYARFARYEVFKTLMLAGDYLLTAHHKDDQAETLLLQLLRGAGVKGLASMPKLKPFGGGYHLRPFLAVSRTELEKYSQQKKIIWINDDSNQNLRFDRNFIRHEIMPSIQQRWLQASTTLVRAAEHCAEAALLLEELACEDLLKIQGEHPNTLSIQKISKLSQSRWHNVFRYWLQQKNLALPTKAQLQQVTKDILQTKADANPVVNWSNVIIRRYRDDIYISKKHSFDSTESLAWDLKKPLVLPSLGILTAELKQGEGINQEKILTNKVTVRFRVEGERCQPAGRVGSHPLKKLLQEWNVPPWKRKQIPLIFCEKNLAAVVGFTVCQPFITRPDEMGWVITLAVSEQ